VILIDFPDYPHNVNDTVSNADSKFFGNGNPDNYPYESLKNYYLRSSYGKLNITGTVYGWYTAAHIRSPFLPRLLKISMETTFLLITP